MNIRRNGKSFERTDYVKLGLGLPADRAACSVARFRRSRRNCRLDRQNIVRVVFGALCSFVVRRPTTGLRSKKKQVPAKRELSGGGAFQPSVPRQGDAVQIQTVEVKI